MEESQSQIGDEGGGDNGEWKRWRWSGGEKKKGGEWKEKNCSLQREKTHLKWEGRPHYRFSFAHLFVKIVGTGSLFMKVLFGSEAQLLSHGEII